jgi:hypothetical protein
MRKKKGSIEEEKQRKREGENASPKIHRDSEPGGTREIRGTDKQ